MLSFGFFLIVAVLPAVMGSLIVICSTVGELVMFNSARQVGNVRQVGDNAGLNGVPASQVVIDQKMGIY